MTISPRLRGFLLPTRDAIRIAVPVPLLPLAGASLWAGEQHRRGDANVRSSSSPSCKLPPLLLNTAVASREEGGGKPCAKPSPQSSPDPFCGNHNGVGEKVSVRDTFDLMMTGWRLRLERLWGLPVRTGVSAVANMCLILIDDISCFFVLVCVFCLVKRRSLSPPKRAVLAGAKFGCRGLCN
jgi:hypothetical protein